MAVTTLSPMRYKGFVWPHNPRSYTIEYRRRMAAHPAPGGNCGLEALGQDYRIMRGEGEFVGEAAYRQFKELAGVFYENTPGLLVHPVWQAADAYFVELSLVQEPRANYVRYRFAFWECPPARAEGLKEVGTLKSPGGTPDSGGQTAADPAVYHTVVKGETLWAIGAKYGVALNELIRMNPQIKNPNLILVGQRVRVSG